MRQIRLSTYANNELRYGWDELPYFVRSSPSEKDECGRARQGREFQVAREKYLRDNSLFCFTDKDGVVYTGNHDRGYECFSPDVRQLDIIAKSQQSSKAGSIVKKHSHGSPVIKSSFTRNARHRLLEGGACFDLRLGATHSGYFGTFTLPGSTERAYDALSRWSGYVANRLTQVLRRAGKDVYWFYVWELQRRGALHLHLFVALPQAWKSDDIERKLRGTWYRALQSVGDAEGICLFQHGKGNYCTISGLWQFDWQSVVKSPAAYISKYVSKSANTPARGRGFRSNPREYPPHRWWSMSRNLKQLIDEERFDVCIHAVSDDACIHAMQEVDDFISDIGESLGYEYLSDIGRRGEGGPAFGVTYRKIRYFPREEWPLIRCLIQHKWWQIALRYEKHYVGYSYGSNEYEGVRFADVL